MANKYDPLEDAKIAPEKASKDDDRRGRRGSVPQPRAAQKASDDELIDDDEVTGPTPLIEYVPPPEKRYRVLADKQISWDGNITKLKAGSVVRERGYDGPKGIQRLISAGVELELMK